MFTALNLLLALSYQVEVDEAKVKQELGQIQMAFVKKAELRNKDRATRHVFYR